MKNTIKKIIAAVIAAAVMLCAFASCTKSISDEPSSGKSDTAAAKTLKVGICNYDDDASLNQIVDNIKSQLETIGKQNNVTFDISYDNCNADSNVMSQIISNFIADKVDLMVAVATPVAMAMQSATEGTDIPVVFAAVSDPISVSLVDSLEKPGKNITGTSDYLDTDSVMKLINIVKPETKNVALLYDVGQDSATSAIEAAKKYLSANNINYKEYTGTSVDEVSLAVDSIIADKMDAVFTPTDNTVMKSELTIYEKLADAKIPHFTGADSFALNGAFLGYGVDYANLGAKTADIIGQILIEGKNAGDIPVLTFDNGTATINTETCEKIGLDYNKISADLAPYCTKVQSITTAEEFE